jgi:hypothetical protein
MRLTGTLAESTRFRPVGRFIKISVFYKDHKTMRIKMHGCLELAS